MAVAIVKNESDEPDEPDDPLQLYISQCTQ